MLFAIRIDTPKSTIFSALNNALGYFLVQSIHAIIFDETLFNLELRDAIWSNHLTKSKFIALWDAIQNLSIDERHLLSQNFIAGQDVARFYSDGVSLPSQIDARIEVPFAILSKHLFASTTHLVKVETVCRETLKEHFNAFRADFLNGNICAFCGIGELAEYRENVEDIDQWRAPYDHLLSKKDYPMYAVHPDNLLPSCDVCNRDAKRAKNLLFNSEGGRRLCFYPPECAHQNVTVQLNINGIGPTVDIFFNSIDPFLLEKMATWDDVYEIKNRIGGQFRNLIRKLDEDFPVGTFREFRASLIPKASAMERNLKFTGMSFWKSQLYIHMNNESDHILESIWAAVLASRDSISAQRTFFPNI